MNRVWPGVEESQQAKKTYGAEKQNLHPDDNGQELHWSEPVLLYTVGLIKRLYTVTHQTAKTVSHVNITLSKNPCK